MRPRRSRLAQDWSGLEAGHSPGRRAFLSAPHTLHGNHLECPAFQMFCPLSVHPWGGPSRRWVPTEHTGSRSTEQPRTYPRKITQQTKGMDVRTVVAFCQNLFCDDGGLALHVILRGDRPVHPNSLVSGLPWSGTSSPWLPRAMPSPAAFYTVLLIKGHGENRSEHFGVEEPIHFVTQHILSTRSPAMSS